MVEGTRRELGAHTYAYAFDFKNFVDEVD